MSDQIVVPFQDLYSPSLRHQTKVIQDQVDSGLYVVKRFAYFLQKIMLVRKPSINEMLKITEHEKEKLERAQNDRMIHHVVTYTRTQNTYHQMLTDELKFVQAVLDSVAEPLLKWHKEAEKRRDVLVKKELALNKTYREVQNKVQHAREIAHKAWMSLQADRRDILKAQQFVREAKKNADKDLKNAEKKLEKDKAKTEAEFRKLEILVQQSNTFQDNYWSQDLPAIVQEWEKLEVDRLHTFGAHIVLYSLLQTQAVNPVQAAATIYEEAVSHLDGASEMRDFVQAIVRLNGLPVTPTPFIPQLPCSSIELESCTASRANELLDMDMQVAIQSQISEYEEVISSSQSNTTTLGSDQNDRLSQTTNPLQQQIYNDQRENQASFNSPPPSYYRETVSDTHSPVSPTPTSQPASAHDSNADRSQSQAHIAPTNTIESSNNVHSPLPAPNLVASPPPTQTIPAPPSTESVPPVVPPSPIQRPYAVCYFRAIYEFTSADEEDLPFNEGDIIALLEEPEGADLRDPGATAAWWTGAVVQPDGSHGRSGSFPSNYVSYHQM